MKKIIIKAVIELLFYAALFITGAGAGLCINVLVSRGVPVINGGGELLLLFALPSNIAMGFNLGVKYITRKGRRDSETVKHTD